MTAPIDTTVPRRPQRMYTVIHVRSIPHVRHCFGEACNRPVSAHPRRFSIALNVNFHRSLAKSPLPTAYNRCEKLTDGQPKMLKARDKPLWKSQVKNDNCLTNGIASSSTTINDEVNCAVPAYRAVNFSWTIFPAPAIAAPYINRTESVFKA